MNKVDIYNMCCLELNDRITQIKDSLYDVQQAANNETKSTVGDKHETGRAMAQLETEKLINQLNQLLLQQKVLNTINPNNIHKIIGLGSLVKTDRGLFYISISLGKLVVNNKECIVISNNSPIAELLNSKTVGDTIKINGVSYTILNVV